MELEEIYWNVQETEHSTKKNVRIQALPSNTFVQQEKMSVISVQTGVNPGSSDNGIVGGGSSDNGIVGYQDGQVKHRHLTFDKKEKNSFFRNHCKNILKWGLIIILLVLACVTLFMVYTKIPDKEKNNEWRMKEPEQNLQLWLKNNEENQQLLMKEYEDKQLLQMTKYEDNQQLRMTKYEGNQQLRMKEHDDNQQLWMKEHKDNQQLLMNLVQTITKSVDKLYQDLTQQTEVTMCSNPYGCETKQNHKTHKFHCYKLQYIKLSWHKAVKRCQAMGGFLAEIHDSESLQYVKRLIQRFGPKAVWLGASDAGHGGIMTWVTSGKPISVTDWAAGQPDNAGNNKDCLGIQSTPYGRMWNDQECSVQQGFLCQKNADLCTGWI